MSQTCSTNICRFLPATPKVLPICLNSLFDTILFLGLRSLARRVSSWLPGATLPPKNINVSSDTKSFYVLGIKTKSKRLLFHILIWVSQVLRCANSLELQIRVIAIVQYFVCLPPKFFGCRNSGFNIFEASGCIFKMAPSFVSGCNQ